MLKFEKYSTSGGPSCLSMIQTVEAHIFSRVKISFLFNQIQFRLHFLISSYCNPYNVYIAHQVCIY